MTLRAPAEAATNGALGITGYGIGYTDEPHDPVTAVALGARRTVDAATLVLRGIVDFVNNLANPPISGPVGIANTIGFVRTELIAGIRAPKSVERFVVVDPEQVADEVVSVLRHDRSRTVAVPTPAGVTARVSNNLPIALRDFLFRASGGNRVTTGLDREARASYQQKMES